MRIPSGRVFGDGLLQYLLLMSTVGKKDALRYANNLNTFITGWHSDFPRYPKGNDTPEKLVIFKTEMDAYARRYLPAFQFLTQKGWDLTRHPVPNSSPTFWNSSGG